MCVLEGMMWFTMSKHTKRDVPDSTRRSDMLWGSSFLACFKTFTHQPHTLGFPLLLYDPISNLIPFNHPVQIGLNQSFVLFFDTASRGGGESTGFWFDVFCGVFLCVFIGFLLPNGIGTCGAAGCCAEGYLMFEHKPLVMVVSFLVRLVEFIFDCNLLIYTDRFCTHVAYSCT